MPLIAERRADVRSPSPAGLPPLQNGDRLNSAEFLRRYEAMPEVKKAELIDGTVFMGWPVSTEHSEADGLAHLWLGVYSAHTPQVVFHPNATVLLGPRNAPQPDASLCLKTDSGGHTRINAQKYLVGPPELVVEIAATSASIDLGSKAKTYARAGVGEVLGLAHVRPATRMVRA